MLRECLYWIKCLLFQRKADFLGQKPWLYFLKYTHAKKNNKKKPLNTIRYEKVSFKTFHSAMTPSQTNSSSFIFIFNFPLCLKFFKRFSRYFKEFPLKTWHVSPLAAARALFLFKLKGGKEINLEEWKNNKLQTPAASKSKLITINQAVSKLQAVGINGIHAPYVRQMHDVLFKNWYKETNWMSKATSVTQNRWFLFCQSSRQHSIWKKKKS